MPGGERLDDLPKVTQPENGGTDSFRKYSLSASFELGIQQCDDLNCSSLLPKDMLKC